MSLKKYFLRFLSLERKKRFFREKEYGPNKKMFEARSKDSEIRTKVAKYH